MYEAEGNQVYVIQDGVRKLFLTVHDTDTVLSPDTQASFIARLFEKPSTWGRMQDIEDADKVAGRS